MVRLDDVIIIELIIKTKENRIRFIKNFYGIPLKERLGFSINQCRQRVDAQKVPEVTKTLCQVLEFVSDFPGV